MTIHGSILPGAISIARSLERTGQLTERAKHKRKVLGHRSHREKMAEVLQKELQGRNLATKDAVILQT